MERLKKVVDRDGCGDGDVKGDRVDGVNEVGWGGWRRWRGRWQYSKRYGKYEWDEKGCGVKR